MEATSTLTLSSPAFSQGEMIPSEFTCNGTDMSPPLSINGVPASAVSLTLIVHDPDAPSGDYLHWIAWNIDPNVRTLSEDTMAPEAVEGMNDGGRLGYMGPCPPSGTHRYLFELYALDSQLHVPPTASRAAVLQAMNGHIIARGTLMGTCSAS